MADVLVLAVIGLIVGCAVGYIYKKRRSGIRCIGCPDAPNCGGKCSSCSGCCGSCRDE